MYVPCHCVTCIRVRLAYPFALRAFTFKVSPSVRPKSPIRPLTIPADQEKRELQMASPPLVMAVGLRWDGRSVLPVSPPLVLRFSSGKGEP